MENCPYHADHDNRIARLEKNIDELDDRFIDCERNSAVTAERVANALENLSRLPEAIDSLKETNIKLENKIDNVDNKVNGLTKDFEGIKTEIRVIDDDGKINFRRGFKNWFVKNWISVAIAITLLAYVTKDIFVK